jgi:protein farnesyltransferase/geranylgeranyltransferase type-1 subunit alpha
MATQEHSPRALTLTAHIIDLNPAHYTVWLYRASILFSLKSDLHEELRWVNEVALANQKNYQIWHHRQLLIDSLYPSISSDREKVLELVRGETEFMALMFELDSKNYHVWSYRQYLVRKLDLFPSQCEDPSELATIEQLLREDIRNNSAWSHRFFVVFSDPGHSTPNSRPLEQDPKLPKEIVTREVEFSKREIRKAPQNQSGWNYLRGVLKKGGKNMASLEAFAREFVRFEGDGMTGEGKGEGEEEGKGEGEEVTSSHALDFLADMWAERGEKEKAGRALGLLGDKYDRIRKNYWEWRREGLREENVAA